ncbi:peptide ABC transporter substrate-binding protein [Arsenicicoccus sp. oral taxon 190]|uniref:peptide ABC transporter substrate-binding protein n=1 Tax=Arsenicicoccus sp. oral taxon 190 TaxID=1658671 RepID=UPI00067A0074|nr:ABC transporter substrate-binding protein [Arsenicicoccus sp. oral taxon 190]AKT51697.1 peptide ABC transporter substrate-binding protein [Arsenicicoccus sp. oral taxon 190]
MRATTRLTLTATLSATAVLLTACGGGSTDNGSSGNGSAAGKSGGQISVRGCNPENPLIPGATTETCGGDVLDTVTARLVHYNVDTAKPENDIAESIETTDNQNFTVKLKKGYKFSDGTEVKAKNFVDAWNYTALSTNAQGASYFMEPIEGFADLQAEKDQQPKAKTMSGLKVVDDYTFTIKTTDKVSNLPERLGYTAFAPLPDVFMKDPKAFGDKPVGAGPYMVDSWTKNQSIVVKKNPNYSGNNKGALDQITFKIYQDSQAAYNDVMAGNLDVTDEVPSSAINSDKYKSDLPDRNAQKEYGGIATMTFASAKADPSVQNPKLRQAISMAVDRDAIIKSQFNGTRTPATGWVATTVNGYKADACGEYCKFDAAKAKAKLQEAGGFTGKLTLSYNADASHKDWTEATCQSIKEALSIDCVATPVVDFKTFRTQVKKREMKGLFRTGWQMDYPSIENFLTPIFATGASSNDGDYSNKAFDAKLKEAAAATDSAKANELYQEAEKMLATDMPSIPLWYPKATIGWSDKVTNVKISAFGKPDYAGIKMK